MKAIVDCEALRELIPAYSIGATDDAETQLIERSIADCPELVDEITVYRRVEDKLGQSVAQVAPPPELLGNLLSIAHQPQRGVKPLRTQRIWLIAAACIALLLIANNLFWIRRVDEIERRITSDAAQTLYLPSGANGLATNATARIVWIAGSDEGYLLANNFPAQSPDTVYQAWVRQEGVINNLGVFTIDAQGNGFLPFNANPFGGTFESTGVTLEPLGGSPGPTSPAIVSWQRQPQ